MDFVVGIVSRNLATMSNFVEFRDSRNFTFFKAPRVVRDTWHFMSRAGNLSPACWVSPTNPKLGPGWALIFLARKNQAKFSPARIARWAKHY